MNGCTSTQTVSNSEGGNFVFRVDFSIEFQRSGSSRNPVIITQGASERIRFPLDDLIYVEACQHRLILHTVQGDFSTRCTFAGLTVCLASTGRFFRNGKGLLINFSHVALVQATGEVLLKNGQTVFCSRRRKRETREAFLAYARTLSRRL